MSEDLRIKLTHKVRMPYSNEYLDKGTILLVEDIRGTWYVCRTDNDSIICVDKNDCEVIEK